MTLKRASTNAGADDSSPNPAGPRTGRTTLVRFRGGLRRQAETRELPRYLCAGLAEPAIPTSVEEVATAAKAIKLEHCHTVGVLFEGRHQPGPHRQSPPVVKLGVVPSRPRGHGASGLACAHSRAHVASTLSSQGVQE